MTAQEKSPEDMLRQLRHDYEASLSAKLKHLADLWETFKSNPADEDVYSRFHRIVHGFAGSGATYGFPKISEVARAFEIQLKEHRNIEQLTSFYEKLEETLANPSKGVPSQEGSAIALDRSNHLVYIVSNTDEADELVVFLNDNDCKPVLLDNILMLSVEIKKAVPRAIILDSIFPKGDEAAYQFIAKMRNDGSQPIPLIYISDKDDIHSRLAAVRSGGLFYLSRPFEKSALLVFLKEIFMESPENPYRVMVVDDEYEQAAYHAALLKRVGIETLIVTKPLNVLRQVEDFKPELILMDLYMPECNGLELAAVIRQFQPGGDLSIVFLSTESDLNRQMAALNLAGDDFLMKPVEPWHLIAKSTARLKQIRRLYMTTRELKRSLIETEKARDLAYKATKEKSNFLANMSHEIRTPMNGVLGMAQLLKTTDLSERQADYVDTISHAGDALLNLIQDILDFSKIEAGKITIEQVPFQLPKLVNHVVSLLHPNAEKKHIDISAEFVGDVPEWLLGDETRIRQILLNLANNAVKFTDTGYVKVHVEVAPLEKDFEVKVEVEDSGIGIAEDTQDAIFERFTQATHATHREFGGTGLGLTICQRLIELMNGEIGVRSVEGEGSTFWFKLALPKTSVIASHKAETSQAGLVTYGHILLVEDNAVNIKVATKMLQKIGMSCDVALNGKIAVEQWEDNEYDLILMDCRMPVLDGYEATKAIRMLEQGHGREAIPILGLSASATLEEQKLAQDSGMDDFLSKPVKIDLLKDKLVKWLSTKNG